MLLLIDGMFVPCSARLSQPSQLALPFLRAPSRLQIVGDGGKRRCPHKGFTFSVLCGTGTHGVRPRGVVGCVGLSPEAKKICCGGAVGSDRRVTRQQLCVNDATDDLKTYVA